MGMKNTLIQGLSCSITLLGTSRKQMDMPKKLISKSVTEPGPQMDMPKKLISKSVTEPGPQKKLNKDVACSTTNVLGFGDRGNSAVRVQTKSQYNGLYIHTINEEIQVNDYSQVKSSILK